MALKTKNNMDYSKDLGCFQGSNVDWIKHYQTTSSTSLDTTSKLPYKYLLNFLYYMYQSQNPIVKLQVNNGFKSISSLNFMCHYQPNNLNISYIISKHPRKDMTLPWPDVDCSLKQNVDFKCAPKSYLFYGPKNVSNKELKSFEISQSQTGYYYDYDYSYDYGYGHTKAKANMPMCQGYLGKIQSDLPMVALDVSQYRQYTDQELFSEYLMLLGGYIAKDAMEMILQCSGAPPIVDASLPKCKTSLSGSDVKSMLKYLDITQDSKIEDILRRLGEWENNYCLTQQDLQLSTSDVPDKLLQCDTEPDKSDVTFVPVETTPYNARNINMGMRGQENDIVRVQLICVTMQDTVSLRFICADSGCNSSSLSLQTYLSLGGKECDIQECGDKSHTNTTGTHEDTVLGVVVLSFYCVVDNQLYYICNGTFTILNAALDEILVGVEIMQRCEMQITMAGDHVSLLLAGILKGEKKVISLVANIPLNIPIYNTYDC